MNEIFRRSVKGMSISMRASQGLESANIEYVGELVQCTEEELLRIRNFGRKCLNEVKAALADMGLSLKISN